jgi:predicted transcriptional regulator
LRPWPTISPKLAQELGDRAEGRPRQALDTTATLQVTSAENLHANMTDEQLADRRKALLRIVQQTESEPMSEGIADGTIVPN